MSRLLRICIAYMVNMADLEPEMRILAEDRNAIAKIKELWRYGPRDQAQIARLINYPEP